MSQKQQPSNNPDPKNDNPSLEELYRPPRIRGRVQVDALFESGRPEDFKELARILYQSESDRLLSYIGVRVGAELSPEHVGLACDLMRLGSFPAISSFLSCLAKREFARSFSSEPAITAGPEYRELRRLIVEVAVWSDFAFTEKDMERFIDEIPSITSFPIAILRQSAGGEIDDTVVKAVTRGGLCVDTNRRGLEILIARESSSQERVLSEGAITSIAANLSSLLRDPFNRVLTAALVDRWLAKQGQTYSSGDVAIRDMLIAEWNDLSSREFNPSNGECIKALDTIRLLRHFDDPVTKTALRSAADHSHPAVSILAKLVQPDQRGDAISAIQRCLSGDVPLEMTLQALRLFGQPISSEIDEALWPIFERYIQEAWTLSGTEEADDVEDTAARAMVLQSMLRRFFTEDPKAPFLTRLFASVGTEDKSMASLAVNTLTQVAALGQIPFLTFYEDMTNVRPVYGAVKILSSAVKKDPSNTIARGMLEGLEGVFVLQGPASYGFELSFNLDSSPS